MSPKRAWSGSRDQVYYFAPHDISSERLKLQTSNFVPHLARRSTNLQMTNCPPSGRGQGHVTHSWIPQILKYLWNSCSYLSDGGLIIPERDVARGMWSILEIYTLLYFSGMAEDRIVKFCAAHGFAREVLVLWWQTVPKWAWSRSRDVLCFGK